MQHRMHNVMVEAFEISLHGCLDLSGWVVGAFGCIENLVAFFEERGKCGVAQLKPSFTLALVMGGSEGPPLQNDLLIAVLVHVWSCQGQQVFIVHHAGMFL